MFIDEALVMPTWSVQIGGRLSNAARRLSGPQQALRHVAVLQHRAERKQQGEREAGFSGPRDGRVLRIFVGNGLRAVPVLSRLPAASKHWNAAEGVPYVSQSALSLLRLPCWNRGRCKTQRR
jgi:hypothetical protein